MFGPVCPTEAGSGQIAGIASAIGVALLGAASSYFAYQKKKLCFKLQGGQYVYIVPYFIDNTIIDNKIVTHKSKHNTVIRAGFVTDEMSFI